MMLGERSYGGGTAHAPPWSSAANDPPTSYVTSPTAADDYSIFFQTDSLNSLQRFLPSNSNDVAPELHFSDSDNGEFFPSCDHFRMYEFKVRKCTRGRSHDWTECPFAHPGEKARRRDPRKYHYSGAACPEFRKGSCRKGDACEFSHGVFECWLHPARYRTQPCKDGMNCKRRVCFFAHLPDQLRLPSPRGESISPPIETPPMMAGSVHEMAAALRRLQLDKVKSMPPSWRGGCSSPRLKVGYLSMPTTPTGTMGGTGLGLFDAGESEERVKSGRDLREKMFEKLSKENPLDTNLNPDVEWVSDLVK